MTSRLSNLRTLRHACTIYSSDNQHGVSRNSHAFNCLCGDQFNKCVCGLDAIVTRDKILRTHENGVSRMSALRKRDERTRRVNTVKSAYTLPHSRTVLYERLHTVTQISLTGNDPPDRRV